VAATWSFTYTSASSTGGGETTVTDPNGHVSVYDTTNAGQVGPALNPLGQARGATWNSDDEPTSEK
jgi:hypothetical protein